MKIGDYEVPAEFEDGFTRLLEKATEASYKPADAWNLPPLVERLATALNGLRGLKLDVEAAAAVFSAINYFTDSEMDRAWREACGSLQSWLAERKFVLEQHVHLFEKKDEGHIKEFCDANAIARNDVQKVVPIWNAEELVEHVKTVMNTPGSKSTFLDQLDAVAARPVWIVIWDLLLGGGTVSTQLGRIYTCIKLLRPSEQTTLGVLCQMSTPEAETRVKTVLRNLCSKGLCLEGEVFTGVSLSDNDRLQQSPRIPAALRDRVTSLCEAFYTLLPEPGTVRNLFKSIGPLGYSDNADIQAGWLFVRQANAPNNTVPLLWLHVPHEYALARMPLVVYRPPFPRKYSKLGHGKRSSEIVEQHEGYIAVWSRELAELRKSRVSSVALRQPIGLQTKSTSVDEEPEFTRDIVNEIFSMVQSQPKVAKTCWVNVYGDIGIGKSQALYALRKLFRHSTAFVDCLLEPTTFDFDEHLLIQWLLDRLGGHFSGLVPYPRPRSALEQVLEEFAAQGKSIVFMVDNCNRFRDEHLLWCLERLNSFDPAAVICASHHQLDHSVPLSIVSFVSLPIGVFTDDEAEKLLSGTKRRLEDQTWDWLLGKLKSEDAARHPVVLDQVLRATNKVMTHSDFVAHFQEFLTRPDAAIVHRIKDICRSCGCEERLAYELPAAAWLTPEHIDLLAGRQLNLEATTNLLEEFYRSGFASRHRPRYLLKEFVAKALERVQKPSTHSFAMLLRHELEAPGFSFERANVALRYMDGAHLTMKKKRKLTGDVLLRLAEVVPLRGSFPGDLALADRFELIIREAPPRVRTLYADYLECQGNYEHALALLDEVTSDDAGMLRLRLWDKLGKFEEMQRALARSGIDIDIARNGSDVTQWPAALWYHYGRYLQVAGSLGDALLAYQQIEQYDFVDLALRVHALIEQATIWVFAEQPEPAIPLLAEAADLLADDASAFRQRADLFRYQARVEKLRVYKELSRGGRPCFDQVQRLISQVEQVVRFYREGRIWALVLRARVAYFETRYPSAIKLFNEAEELICGYGGGLPHLLRHRALAHAMAEDYVSAEKDLRQAITLAQADRRLFVVGMLMDTWGKVSVAKGDEPGARDKFGQAEQILRTCGLLEEPFSALSARYYSLRHDVQNALETRPPW